MSLLRNNREIKEHEIMKERINRKAEVRGFGNCEQKWIDKNCEQNVNTE